MTRSLCRGTSNFKLSYDHYRLRWKPATWIVNSAPITGCLLRHDHEGRCLTHHDGTNCSLCCHPECPLSLRTSQHPDKQQESSRTLALHSISISIYHCLPLKARDNEIRGRYQMERFTGLSRLPSAPPGQADFSPE